MIPKIPTPATSEGSPISPVGSIKPVDNLRVYTKKEIADMTSEQMSVAIGKIKEAKMLVEEQRLKAEGLAKSIAPLGGMAISNRANSDPNLSPSTPEHSPTIAEQYAQQLDTLKAIGLLDQNGSYVYTYTDHAGNHKLVTYTIPTLAEISKRLENKKDLLEQKSSQGFTRLLIVPNGLPLDTYIEKLKEATKKTATRRQVPVLDSYGKPTSKMIDEYYIPDTKGNPVIFDISDPVHTNLIYTDRSKWTAHGAPEDQYTIDTNGFTVHMIEENLDLPREGTNTVIGNRQRIEANKIPKYYMDLLNDTPPYQGESGMTTQDILTLYTQVLHTQGVVMDNINNGVSSSSVATASYDSTDQCVSYLYCDSYYGRWYLTKQGVGETSRVGSVRVSVRV